MQQQHQMVRVLPTTGVLLARCCRRGPLRLSNSLVSVGAASTRASPAAEGYSGRASTAAGDPWIRSLARHGAISRGAFGRHWSKLDICRAAGGMGLHARNKHSSPWVTGQRAKRLSCGATNSSKLGGPHKSRQLPRPCTYTADRRLCKRSTAAHSRQKNCPAAGTFAPSSTESSDVEQGEEPAKQTVMLDVSGMMCGGCSAAVKNILVKQPGVQGAAVNLITHAAAVTVRWG